MVCPRQGYEKNLSALVIVSGGNHGLEKTFFTVTVLMKL